ncbi:MAG: hypothetical protein JW918_06625 [Anaerolineae bacterium]|nr:hypothetical protein [Anaerolineae bacterium]
MKRTTWIVLALVTLSAWTVQAAPAQDDAGLTISASVGFDGYCRADSWCPVYVVLSNEGADLEGELRASLEDVDGSSVYVKPIALPAHSRKAFFFTFPFYDLVSHPHVGIKFMAGKKTLVSKTVAAVLVEENERLYGFVSSAPSEFNFLGTVSPVGGKARSAQLDLASLPPDPLAWEGLNALVLNDVDTTALRDEQRQALERWVAHGGHLIVGGGAGSAGTVAGLPDLLPVSIGGTRSVDDLWGLGEFMGAPVAPGPYAIVEATLRDGEALVEQEGAILVARRAYGGGGVTFLAFDAGVNPFVDWDDNVLLWRWLLEEAEGSHRLGIRNGYQAHEAVNTIPGVQSPSILYILGFLLVYTIVIGPVNYLILRKLDRRELAWVTIPLLILAFSACAYVTGFQVRGFKPIVHRLSVVSVPQGSQVGRVSQVVGLFSPQRTNYDVRLPGAEVRSLPASYYYGGLPGQPLLVSDGVEGVTVTDLRVDVGGIEPFIAEGYVDVAGVDAALRFSKEAGRLYLEGTMRNGQVALKDAVLIVGGRIESLGDLAAGQEVPVRMPFNSGSLPAYTLVERILGSSDYWNDTRLYRRYVFLGAVLNPNDYGPYASSGVSVRTGLEGGIYLVGWSDESVPLSAEVVGRSYSAIETALYVYALPVAEAAVAAGLDIPSDLIQRELVDVVGRVEDLPEGVFMEMQSEATFRFSIWPGVEVGEVDEIILDMQGPDYTLPPAVSIWNVESEDWHRLDVGWGQSSIPNAGRYISPSGSVLLRLETVNGVVLENLALAIKGQ